MSALEAERDPGAALTELGNAVGALIGQGAHYKLGQDELPFGKEGLQNVARLFGRFMDALPDGLKRKIEEAAARFGASGLLKSIPVIGNVASGVSAIGAAKDLIQDIRKPQKDWVQISIDAAQTGLDVAGIFPALNELTGPLQTVLGTVKVIKGAADLVGDLKQFQQGLLGF